MSFFQETTRKYAKKMVTLPNQTQIPVRVITEIEFRDTAARGQKYTYTVNNTQDSNRKVHIDQVSDTVSNVPIQVERIDHWSVRDTVARGQKSDFVFDNVTQGDSPPPYFISHKKTHLVTYRNGDNQAASITSELIDQFVVRDTPARGQQATFILNNPQNDDDAQAQDGDPDITIDGGEGFNQNPVRTDPFQNIVKIMNGSIFHQYIWFIFQTSWNITLDAATGKVAVTVEGHPAEAPTEGIPGGPDTVRVGAAFTRDPDTPPPLSAFGSITIQYTGSYGGIPTPTPTSIDIPSGYGIADQLPNATDAFVPTIPYQFVRKTFPFDMLPGGVASADFSGLTFAVGNDSRFPGNVLTPVLNSLGGGPYGPSGTATYGIFGPYPA